MTKASARSAKRRAQRVQWAPRHSRMTLLIGLSPFLYIFSLARFAFADGILTQMHPSMIALLIVAHVFHIRIVVRIRQISKFILLDKELLAKGRFATSFDTSSASVTNTVAQPCILLFNA